MQFVRFGIELERLTSAHLEMVRTWRNADRVRTKMRFTEKINPQQQIAWFNKLDPISNWYFIASSGNRTFALLHIKDIQWDTEEGEAGAFVNNGEYIGELETGLAILALMDFAFMVLGLQKLCASYHPQFEKIVALNRMLGYTVDEIQEDGFIKASVQTDVFVQKTTALRRTAEKMYGNETYVRNQDKWLAERKEYLEKKQWPYRLPYQVLPPSF